MVRSKTITFRAPLELAERVEAKLKATGEDMSAVLRSALRSFAGDDSAAEAFDVAGYDLLLGAQIALRKLADRSSVVQPGTPEADMFLRDLRTFLDDLERAKKKARRRVKAIMKKGAAKQ